MAERHVSDVAILGSKLLRDEGDDVVRIDASGVKPPSQKHVALIGTMRFVKNGFIRTLCVLPEQTHGEYAARCEKLAQSIHAK